MFDEHLKSPEKMAKQPNNRVSFNNICSIQQYDVDQGKLRDEPKNETNTDTDEFFVEIKRKSQSQEMLKNGIANHVRSQADQKKDEDSLAGLLSFTRSPKLQQDDARETMPAITPEKFYLEQTEQQSFIPMRDDTIQKDESRNFVTPIKLGTPYRAFPQSSIKDQCKTLRKGAIVTYGFNLNGSICSDSDAMEFIQEENSQVSPAKMGEELSQAIETELESEFDEQSFSSGDSYYEKPKIIDKEVDSLYDTTILSVASENICIKLSETAAKLTEIEDKFENRRGAIGFKQILAEVKLNRTLAQEASSKAESSRCPPLKQSRYNVNESPSNINVAIPTAFEQTPIPNIRKSQQWKPLNGLQLWSVTRNPRRQILQDDIETLTKAQKCTTAMLGSSLAHYPVPLKSLKDLQWAQMLCHDPNWLDEVRPPRWTPLADNHFDLHGPTAGMEKDELRQKAERIVIQTINKFEGKMDFVRKHIFTQGTKIMEKVEPFKKKMLELKKKHENLVEHHNKRVDHYNYLIESLREKRHAENERFITNVKQRITSNIEKWETSI